MFHVRQGRREFVPGVHRADARGGGAPKGPRRTGPDTVQLRENPTIGRWYRNLARGSEITADVYFRRLGNVCEARKVGPDDLVRMTREARRDFLTDLVSSMEDSGLTGGYIESTLKALRSW